MTQPERETIEQQLVTLMEIGITISDFVMVDDLLVFESREALEKKPYSGIIRALGYEIGREPFAPKCNSIWTCDFERIAISGDYRDIFIRLGKMTFDWLGLKEIEDEIDIPTSQTALVRFLQDDEPKTWEADVDGNWLDASIFTDYDRMLAFAGSPVRLYSSEVDDGLAVILAALTSSQKRDFDRISGIEFVPCFE